MFHTQVNSNVYNNFPELSHQSRLYIKNSVLRSIIKNRLKLKGLPYDCSFLKCKHLHLHVGGYSSTSEYDDDSKIVTILIYGFCKLAGPARTNHEIAKCLEINKRCWLCSKLQKDLESISRQYIELQTKGG